MRLGLKNCLIAFMLLAGCASSPPAGQSLPEKAQLEAKSIEVAGRTRTYLLSLPSNYAVTQRWPLVLVLHHHLLNASDAARITQFDDFAYRNGIIAVFPNSYGTSWDWQNSGDIAFFNALLDSLEANNFVDPSRVYATGISNGGVMMFKLGCDLANRIAALAPVAALMPASLSENCHPARPISLLEFNGTSDLPMPYDGGIKLLGTNFGTRLLSAQASAHWWAQVNACAQKPNLDTLPRKSEDGMDTRREIYTGCREGTEVALYSIVGGGHTWPGSNTNLPRITLSGRTSFDLDANSVIWQFFQAHHLPAAQGQGQR